MSWTFVACVGIAFAWMALFYLWGRSFLALIHAETDVASSIAFGYLVLQVIYQAIYLPFYLSRGSYRATAYIWLGIIGIISIIQVVWFRRKPLGQMERLNSGEKIAVLLTGVMVLGLAAYIALHVPFYGADTVGYITTMNNAYYQDTMWIESGGLSVHHGLCSMFHFFTMSSLITGIKPYYISLFSVRIIGICLFSFILYRTGVIIFKKDKKHICRAAAVLAVLAPTLLMFWGSNYTAEFFYWRINEAKGYCQFVLMPLGFSVFLEMFKESTNRKELWKKQFLVALAAIPISTSSMTPYIFLVLIGTVALLAYERLKGGWRTIGSATICALPNVFYLILYILTQKSLLTF